MRWPEPRNGAVFIVALTTDLFSEVVGPSGGALDDPLFKPVDPVALDAALARYLCDYLSAAVSSAAHAIPEELWPKLAEDLRDQLRALRLSKRIGSRFVMWNLSA